jgi:hypothetical protein
MNLGAILDNPLFLVGIIWITTHIIIMIIVAKIIKAPFFYVAVGVKQILVELLLLVICGI